MSNLSDIGFPVQDEQGINDLIIKILGQAVQIPCPGGFYLQFSDPSGAEMYLQGSLDQELLGFNPHFSGKSRRRVGLSQLIERETSPLDGGFHAWADPSGENVESSGEYPFVFDVPDFRTVEIDNFPVVREVQLTAFASNEFRIFAGEEEYYADQEDEPKFAAKSFIPSGMFAPGEDGAPVETPNPFGIFTGEIMEFELKTNQLTGHRFYWFLVETLGGAVDVVADPKLITEEPQVGGIISGQFWLSGRIL